MPKPLYPKEFGKEKAVKCGIALLDEKCPGWRSRINLDTLDMFGNCILKQLYGDYKKGMGEIGLAHKWSDGAVQWNTEAVLPYGFTLFSDHRPLRWDELTEEWRRQLS